MARFLLLALLLWMDCSAAEPVEVFTYAGRPASINDDGYLWRVLRAALERSSADYGDFRLEVSPPMPDRRQIRALIHGESVPTVGIFTANVELCRDLLPVRIPIERGVLSYRVLLVRETALPDFAKVATLADLRSFSFGLMPLWDDVSVMRAAGLTVVPGESHEGLFRMLAAGRFDAFSRGVSEVVPEYQYGQSLVEGLAVEPHLLLHYPLPLYFWFSPDEPGRRRAARVEAGLRAMIADGSLQRMFEAQYAELETRLDLPHRQVIDLSNPLLDGQDPLDDAGLWYRPRP